MRSSSSVQCFAKLPFACADLAGAGKEHEDVAMGLLKGGFDSTGDTSWKQPRALADIPFLNRKGLPAGRDHRRVAEHGRDGAALHGGGHDQELQVPAKLFPDIEAERKGKVCMDAPLMEFVEDDHGHAFEARVGLDAARENAFGHDLDPGLLRPLHVEAYGITHGPAHLLAKRFRHPARGRDSGDPPRFEHDDPALLGRQHLEQRQRDTGGFAGSGRRAQNNGGVLEDRFFERGQDVVDGIGNHGEPSVLGEAILE